MVEEAAATMDSQTHTLPRAIDMIKEVEIHTHSRRIHIHSLHHHHHSKVDMTAATEVGSRREATEVDNRRVAMEANNKELAMVGVDGIVPFKISILTRFRRRW